MKVGETTVTILCRYDAKEMEKHRTLVGQLM
jgi:hypothetical protein